MAKLLRVGNFSILALLYVIKYCLLLALGGEIAGGGGVAIVWESPLSLRLKFIFEILFFVCYKKKGALDRERASFEEALHNDRMAAQRELDTIAGSLQSRLREQTRMYKDAVEEMRLFKVHAHSTADEYKAFVDAQNDDIVRLKELASAQANELERLFDSEMATRRKMEHIENTIFLTEDQVAQAQGRTPMRKEQSNNPARRGF